MPQRGGAGNVTTDHDFIRKWVEERGGHPATVKRTGRGKDPGILRIDYPGYSGQKSLSPIGWDEFFDKFEQNGLAFVYQEKTASGRPSRFSKLVSRESVAGTLRAAPRRQRRKVASGESAGRTGKRKAAASTARRKAAAPKTGRRKTTSSARTTRRKRSS